MTNAQPLSRHVPRFQVIDYGRGLAVLLMIFVHTLWMYADSSVQADSWLGHVIHFIGKGTAAFLIVMGISLSLSKKQSLRSDCLRGLMILAFAYIMNALKFIAPIAVFGTMPESFIEAYRWQSPLTTNQYLYLIGTGDILQMVGISLFIIAFVRHFIQNPWVIIGLAFLIAVLSGELRGLANHHDTFGYVARLLFSNHYQVYFPVFPWISFILLGFAMGLILKQRHFEHLALFNQTFWVGLGSLLSGGGLCFLNFDYHFNNFFHLGLGGVLYLFGINMLLFWGIHRLVEAGLTNHFTQFLSYLSKRVTSIYIIQWIVVCWGMGLIGYQTLNATQTLLLMPIVLCITLCIQWVKEKILRIKNKPVISPELG